MAHAIQPDCDVAYPGLLRRCVRLRHHRSRDGWVGWGAFQRMEQLEMDLLSFHPLTLQPVLEGKDHLLGPAKKDFIHRSQIDQPSAELGAFCNIDPPLIKRNIHFLPAENMI